MRVSRRFAAFLVAAVVGVGLLAGVTPALAWTPAGIATGYFHTVGLKSDGTVVATGDNESGQCDVSGWTDITAVSAGGYHTVGLKSDGTVVATGYDGSGQCDVSGWTNITAVSAGRYHTVALKSDGTVVATGYNDDGRCDVSTWTNITSVTGGNAHTAGLRSDGIALATGSSRLHQCSVYGWRLVVYTIAASAGTNGSISPVGPQSVNYGADRTFTITPATGYHIADVIVDGVSVGALGSYTFTNVTAAHTISATFAINTYTIAASAGAKGAISPSGPQSVEHGVSKTFTITPVAGYRVAGVVVDGVSVGAVRSYTFSNVTANHTIAVTFEQTPVTRSTTTKLTGPSTVRVRRTLKLSGTVAPASATGRVAIVKKRLVGKKWKSAGTVKVKVVGGKYKHSFKPTKRGKWRFVATYTGGKVGVTTYKASKSKVKYVRVR